ncbi:MAG: hypothetical protein ACYTEQ_05385 [Planctomycetota bacterium]|jgi:hypothetical protein
MMTRKKIAGAFDEYKLPHETLRIPVYEYVISVSEQEAAEMYQYEDWDDVKEEYEEAVDDMVAGWIVTSKTSFTGSPSQLMQQIAFIAHELIFGVKVVASFMLTKQIEFCEGLAAVRLYQQLEEEFGEVEFRKSTASPYVYRIFGHGYSSQKISEEIVRFVEYTEKYNKQLKSLLLDREVKRRKTKSEPVKRTLDNWRKYEKSWDMPSGSTRMIWDTIRQQVEEDLGSYSVLDDLDPQLTLEEQFPRETLEHWDSMCEELLGA